MRALNRQPPRHQSKVNFSRLRWPCSGFARFQVHSCKVCMHFTPVLFCSSALITPGSLQFWVVISSQASRVQAPPHTEPHPPHGSAPPACLWHLESPPALLSGSRCLWMQGVEPHLRRGVARGRVPGHVEVIIAGRGEKRRGSDSGKLNRKFSASLPYPPPHNSMI